MDTALIKDFFDCCRDAKKILELLPPLPQGLTPRHIQIVDTISQLEEKNGLVKISDISTAARNAPKHYPACIRACRRRVCPKSRQRNRWACYLRCPYK